eukprot:6987420-Alexandrium_andersonii.AAC.1
MSKSAPPPPSALTVGGCARARHLAKHCLTHSCPGEWYAFLFGATLRGMLSTPTWTPGPCDRTHHGVKKGARVVRKLTSKGEGAATMPSQHLFLVSSTTSQTQKHLKLETPE